MIERFFEIATEMKIKIIIIFFMVVHNNVYLLDIPYLMKLGIKNIFARNLY